MMKQMGMLSSIKSSGLLLGIHGEVVSLTFVVNDDIDAIINNQKLARVH